jgi:hypothetical protein
MNDARPLALVMLAACSASPRSRAARQVARPAVRLTIPQQFRSETGLQLRLDAARQVVRADAQLTLLRHRDAPATHTVQLRLPRVCNAVDGAIEQLRVTAADALVLSEIRDGALRLRPIADGVATVELQGEYVHGARTCAEGVAPATRVALQVRVRVEATSALPRAHLGATGRCGVAGGPFAGANTLVSLEPQWLDAQSQPVYFANVSPLAPFDIHIESTLALTVSPEAQLELPARAGIVRLRAASQRDARIWRWRVGPESVTDAAIEFSVGGSAGAPLPVTEGARIVGSSRKVGAIFARISRGNVGAEPLCDAPDPRWFTMASDTPEVCEIVPVDARSCDECSDRSLARHAARLRRDGVCAIRVEGAALNHGHGVRARVSASFERVDQFVDLGRGAADASR